MKKLSTIYSHSWLTPSMMSRLLYTHLTLFYINKDQTTSGFPFPPTPGAQQGGFGGLSSSLSDLRPYNFSLCKTCFYVPESPFNIFVHFFKSVTGILKTLRFQDKTDLSSKCFIFKIKFINPHRKFYGRFSFFCSTRIWKYQWIQGHIRFLLKLVFIFF